MTTGFAMPNVSDIVYDKMDKCANESLSVTFLMNELDVNFACSLNQSNLRLSKALKADWIKN